MERTKLCFGKEGLMEPDIGKQLSKSNSKTDLYGHAVEKIAI
jgi:hypothetical protein